MAQELDVKTFKGESVEILRSQIRPATYNPRRIDAEGKKKLKRSIKKFGVVGGIVVNKQTDYTIVGGHQKVFILDEIKHYEEGNPDTDYTLRVELVDVDLQTEKAMNIALNNPAVGGQWDYDQLAMIVPDLEDYRDAGLDEASLSMIGLDYLYQTEGQADTADELTSMMAGVQAEHDAEVQQRAEERAAIKEASRQAEAIAQAEADREADREQRIQRMKEVKQQVKEQAMANAADMEAYLVLSFNDFRTKASFCQEYGFDPMQRMIKGEDFAKRCEPAYMDDDIEEEEEEE